MKLKTKKKEIIVHRIYLSEREISDLTRLLRRVVIDDTGLSEQREKFVNMLENSASQAFKE